MIASAAVVSRRTPTGISGIVAIDKPEGMTSHDVINVLRRHTGERRIGHAGTLDPMATGLLVVCVGPATRLADYLMAGEKIYEARICFGAATNTDDAKGEVLRTSALPQQLEDPVVAAHILAQQVGELAQVPPAFSAIKKGGITAYKAARSGNTLVLEPRRVELYEATLLSVGQNYWNVRLVVSKGFYVRSLARDLGELLGSAAYLGELRRTASGKISIEQASQLSSLQKGVPLRFLDPTIALGFPIAEISSFEAQRIEHGMPLALSKSQVQFYEDTTFQQGNRIRSLAKYSTLISMVHARKLLALYELSEKEDLARPRVVIPGGLNIPHNNIT